ncbi:HNH endonuclease [Rhodococcus opacus]|uniref:HNH endonuclease n=1 Tax=Rhodococcus opacus TaxID=37919 RepID=UPI000FFB4E15
MSKHSSKGKAWNELRAIQLDRYNHECAVCGQTENLQLDHIIPKDKGGEDTLENTQILCAYHNNKKNNRIEPEEKSWWSPKYFPDGPIKRPGA